MNSPNFFIVGAPKCGTTALASYLNLHPEVFFSHPKEPTYFNDDFNEKPRAAHSKEEYLQLFREADGFKAVGEGSTRYLSSEVAVKNIIKFNPKAKIIIMLRNPIDMYISLHSHCFYNLVEPEPNPEKAWKLQETRKNDAKYPITFQYGETCMLGRQLENVYKYVPHGQVHVIFFDDFITNTLKVYKDVLNFLELEYDGRLVFEKINETKNYRLRSVQKVMKRISKIKRLLGINRKTRILRWINKLNSAPKAKTVLSTSFKQELADYFTKDVQKIEKNTRRDLSHWLSVKE